ncbi:hypothetical protein H2199_007037 [Coniosporium tulheliwenetii]|uniref:Uncharacterized protein n=1 Tax=Coniosporium tulheliwenetii TaxID=3383036 RepID=A0ACC2YSV5_9PEZI|nr:hypothetical protein H2199_007037 [Cladosporium sp. JES 115]
MAAGTETTENGAPTAAVDEIRARELYKYFKPAFFAASQSSSPDTVLTAHAQLVALRLNVQRALISLCDRGTQYFAAEASKTLSLDDTTKSDDPLDAIWAGPPPDGGPAYFEVLDCTKDERFNKLPFVCGGPCFKYYVGVPIRTKRGVNIGSLFAIDDKVGTPLSESKKQFLSVMADNIMAHLEMLKEKDDRKRSHHMNMCLAAFVDPEHQIRKRKRSRRSTAGSDSHNQPLRTASNVPNTGPGSPAANKLSPNGAASATGLTRNEAEESSVHDSEAEDSGTARIDDHAHLDTFKRASDLLRESLFLDAGGGVVFMDSTALPHLDPRDQTGASFHTSDEEDDRSIFQRRGSLDSIRVKPASTSGNPRRRAPQEGSRARPPADILAKSIVTPISDSVRGDDAADFTPLAAADVAKLIRRYPRGKLFTFEVDGVNSPSSGEDYAYGFDLSKPKRKTPSQTEVQLLLRHFPGARQIIFLPLWDSASSRWSAFFAYNTSDFHLATITEEVVEGIATGQVFKDFTSADVADLAPSTAGHGTMLKAPPRSNVEIILDISPRAWTFVTQPGAFRRIVMNIFGNALKYTKAGFIIVKLDAEELGTQRTTDKHQRDGVTTQVRLTITDSGQGISPQYMRTNLFTPFSQESSINPGTGLGLSLVRSIVTMLNGEINIQSALGVGTEVVVTLPMAKSTPSSSSSGSASTPSSAGSTIERARDDSISLVKENAHGRTVTLFSQRHSDDTPAQLEATKSLQKCLKTYLSGWMDFSVVEERSPPSLSDIVIVNEADVQALLLARPDALDPDSGLSVLILSTNASRHITKINAGAANVDYVSKPVGPIKLARALRRLNEKRENQDSQASSGTQKPETIVEEAGIQSRAIAVSSDDLVDEVVQAVEKVTLKSSDGASSDIPIIKQGSIIASEESSNAQMAMEPPGISEHSDSTEQKEEFPFPIKEQLNAEGIISPIIKPADLEVPGHRPPLNFRRTLSPTASEIRTHEPSHAAPMTLAGADVAAGTPAAVTTATPQAPPSQSPRLLLVDDNKVNLKLLHTFMKKRRYSDIYTAEDGLQAVDIFRNLIASDPPAPPDVCFMDVSMPLMNGFEATREIREIEAQYRTALPAMQTPAPCLIVALTGLASSRDQSEAFTSGMDLYMTKPVSFREVGRLLDNWEANGGAAAPGVPHGPVTGANVRDAPA